MEQQVFKSIEDLMNWVHNFGRSLGYVIITRRSETRPSGLLSKLTLMCDRGGIYKSNKISTRNTKSKKINCPFKLMAKYSKMNGFWTLRVICEEHNHEPSLDMKGHPYAMRLSASESRLVADLSMNNVKPRDILSMLKEQNTNNLSTLKTIYNARQKFKNKLSSKNSIDKPTQEPTGRGSSSLSNFEGSDVLSSHEPTRWGSSSGQIYHSHPYGNQLSNVSYPYIMQTQDVVDDGNCGFRAVAPTLGRHEPARYGLSSGQIYYSHPYINQLPNVFHPYIMQILDVADDGNCGFRAVAASLGRHEDEWSTIRSDLMDELDTHKMEYDKIFGTENRLRLHNCLNFLRSPAPFEHSMTLPEMGIVIASRYNVVLHSLSSKGSVTYLPFMSNPVKAHQHVAITIGLVNDNHFVKVTLRAGYPMPPVLPEWFRFRHQCASTWVLPYIDQMDMYTHSLFPDGEFEGGVRDDFGF